MGGIAARKMHQTTVRFGPDLWLALDEECKRLGLSVAQYVREAALARLAYTAGRRGDDEFEFALNLATGSRAAPEGAAPPPDFLETAVAPASSASNSRERVQREAAESAALWSQGRQARRRASELREEIAMRRAERDALAGMARAATDDDPDDS